MKADDADVTVAKTEAEDLWDALNSADRTGNVVSDIKTKDAAGDHQFRTTIKAATSKAAVSYLTGADFDYDVRGKPPQKGPPKFMARGFIGLDLLGFGVQVRNEGWEDAVFDMIDVTGMGRQFLEAQQNQCPPVYCVA